MSYWNIRIMHRAAGMDDAPEPEYFPAEVHYNDDGKPLGWCRHRVTADELRWLKFYAEEIAKACEEPVLSAEKFPEVHEP